MNLNAYDNITETIDKTKTWVDIRKKLLLSRSFLVYNLKSSTISSSIFFPSKKGFISIL